MGKKPKKLLRESKGPSPVAWAALGAAVPALAVAAAAGLYLRASSLPTIAPARLEQDAEGAKEVFTHAESFEASWAARGDSSDPCWRTDDWHGVPFSVESALPDELDVEALAEYLLSKEDEWMSLPIRDWKETSGPAYNTTSARYDQFNVLTDADSVPVVGALKRFIRRSVRSYLRCVASRGEYFEVGSAAGDYFSQILKRIEPQRLWIMCWVNIFRHDRQHANALHWHVHHWPYQGYLSVTSESSGTEFRSNVHTSRRWRFDHKHGMLFLLPGGTLHASTPWRKPSVPRLTVAFNVAPDFLVRPDVPQRFHKWVWEELFTAEETAQMRAAGEDAGGWGMIVSRPPNPYEECMVGDPGICPGRGVP